MEKQGDYFFWPSLYTGPILGYMTIHVYVKMTVCRYIADPPAALRPTVDLRRSPSPSAGVNKQFNNPIGLYSSSNVQKQQTLVNQSEKSNG